MCFEKKSHKITVISKHTVQTINKQLFLILMNVTFGIQFNIKANCRRQRFVAIPAASSGQLKKFFPIC